MRPSRAASPRKRPARRSPASAGVPSSTRPPRLQGRTGQQPDPARSRAWRLIPARPSPFPQLGECSCADMAAPDLSRRATVDRNTRPAPAGRREERVPAGCRDPPGRRGNRTARHRRTATGRNRRREERVLAVADRLNSGGPAASVQALAAAGRGHRGRLLPAHRPGTGQHDPPRPGDRDLPGQQPRVRLRIGREQMGTARLNSRSLSSQATCRLAHKHTSGQCPH